ncbi:MULTISPECIES: hypothetical protein [unclassified Rhizobium]|nr:MULTISPECIES: hypothetical protein [unclassified Rhizobium]
MNDMIAMAVMTDQIARHYEMRRQRCAEPEARGIRFKRKLRRLAVLFTRP